MNEESTGTNGASVRPGLSHLFVLWAILLAGLAYVWAKGDLDWVLSYRASTYQPPDRRARINLPQVKEIEAVQEAQKAAAPKPAPDGEEAA